MAFYVEKEARRKFAVYLRLMAIEDFKVQLLTITGGQLQMWSI